VGTGIAYLVSNSSVKPRAILGVAAITVLVIVTTLLLVRHFRLAELAPPKLTPKPPQPPKDCSEIRRAVALSTRSLTSGYESPIKIATPLDGDEVAIYRAVIQQWNSDERAALNVSAATLPIDVTSLSERTECGCLAGIAVESLLKASHSFHILARSNLPGNNIRLVDLKEPTAIVNRNDASRAIREERSVNDAVENAFANGLFSVSEIAFDKEHRHALVNYSFHCGLLCGNGAMWAFEKVNGAWKKTDRMCDGWNS
jgi:hypothetical protein